MKKIFFMLCILLISCSKTVDKPTEIEIPDSLLNINNKGLIDSIKNFRYNNPEKAKLFTRILLKKSTEEQDKINSIESYFYFGHIADIQGEYTNAISYINKGISLAKTDQHNVLRKLYNLRGKVHAQYGKYEKAIQDFNSSLQISEKNKDQKGIIIVKINLAVVKLYAKQYYESLKTFKKMLQISEDSTLVSKNSRNSIFIGICDNLLRTEKLDSARIYLDQGIKESIRINDLESASYLYPFDALYYYHKNDIPKSLEILEKARKEISKLQKAEKRNIEVYYYMAQCHFALKEYKTAIEAIEKAFEIITAENGKNLKQPIEDNYTSSTKKKISISKKDPFIPYQYLYLLKTLMQCYEELGDEESRDFYFDKYYPLKFESSQKNVRVSELIFKFHEAPSNALIEKLSQKEGNAEKKVKYLYYVLAILSLGIVVGFILYRKKEQQKKIAYKALIEKISALEAKSNTIDEPKTTTKKTVSITDEKAQAILKGLAKFEAQEHYLDENCNLRFVAKKVKTNATYLSKIINTHKESSFNEYINDLRIQYTLKRLKTDSLFRAYSIKSIAQEVGYKSADSFTKHFKNQTSLYPSYYIKNLNKDKA